VVDGELLVDIEGNADGLEGRTVSLKAGRDSWCLRLWCIGRARRGGLRF